jgi:predicted phosphodiesterase
MRYGIVSDIHANIQAWDAVMRDMRNNGVDAILCLGDVIGYGPNPVEVLDSCYKHCDHFILGNHDAVIGNRLDSNLFNDNAKYLIEWTRDQLSPAAADFFGNMPLRMEGDGFVCAHGELALPGRFGYIYEAQDAIASFTSNDSPIMFVGHTHFPAKFTFDLNANQVNKDDPMDFIMRPDQRYLINAGSVGDPRDGQTTASYCIFDAEAKRVMYRQVPFDIAGFRQNLQKTQLPVNPFFLKVLDGQGSETETIRDMQQIELNQAKESPVAAEKISNLPADRKNNRQKLTFSTDNLRQTRQFNQQKGSRKQAEVDAGQKSKKIIGIVAGVFTLLLIVVVLILRNLMPGEVPAKTKPSTVKVPNNPVEKEPVDVLIEDNIELEKPFLASVVFEDFEGDLFADGWMVRGRAFGHRPLNEARLCANVEVSGYSGKGFAGSAHRQHSNKNKSLTAKGYLFSPIFEVKHKYVKFLATGSGDKKSLVILIVDGKAIKGKPLEGFGRSLVVNTFDLQEYIGKSVQLAFRDDSDEHAVFIDRLTFTDDVSEAFKVNKTTLKGKPFVAQEKSLNSQFAGVTKALLAKNLELAQKELGKIPNLKPDVKVAYSDALNSLKSFSSKVMLSYQQDVGKKITFIHKAASKKYELEIIAAKDGSVTYKEVDKAGSGVLNYDMLSEDEKRTRSKLFPNGEISYFFHRGSLAVKSKDLELSPELKVLLSTDTTGPQETPQGFGLKAKTIEIWLEKEVKNEINKLHITVNSADKSKAIFGKLKRIEELYPNFSKDAFERNRPFKVAVFDLPSEVNLSSIDVILSEGDLKEFTTVVRDLEGKVTWSKSVNGKANAFAKLPTKMWFNRDIIAPKANNLALGKKVSIQQGAQPQFGLTDGVWASKVPFCYMTDGVDEFPKSVVLDLGDLQSANAVKLGSPIQGSTYNYSVSVSTDGKGFQQIGQVYRNLERNDQYTLFFKGRKIRYVKVTFLKNHDDTYGHENKNNAFLSELEVYNF